jgi:hypothetical protein
MRSKIHWMAAAAILAVLALSGCAEVSEAKHTAVEPYTKEETADAGRYRVKLAESAVKRLDVKTAVVTQERGKSGAIRKVIPYAAIIYDLNGDTWTYTNPETFLYVREAIRVDYIEAGRAFLIEGPRLGMPVVIAGAAQLYGIEFGLGK